MPDSATLLTFVAIAAVFAAVPGPSNLFVVSQGLRAGHRAGLAAAAGCALGALTYVAATTVGLAAVLASSAPALSLLHYVGGAYLLFLGIRLLRDRPAPLAFDVGGSDPARPVPRARFLRRGLLIELSNPKVALFFLAFFPQFVDPHQGPAQSQILILGAIFSAVGLASDSLYALASGEIRKRVVSSPWLLLWSNRASGTMCLGLGAWSILSGARPESR
jgi:threonine/homoserine/homoserine lactone efflux protein